MDQAGVQQGSYFPYAVHGGKTLAPATVATYKGQQYVSYNLDHQETTVPTDIYYMPKGASAVSYTHLDVYKRQMYRRLVQEQILQIRPQIQMVMKNMVP